MHDIHIMVDLETVAKVGKIAFFSLGAVAFDPFDEPVQCPVDPSDTFRPPCFFYELVNLESALNAGLEMDADTVYWWISQDITAKQEFIRSQKEGRDPHSVLNDFRDWVQAMDGKYLWSHGAVFDVPILRNAFFVCGFGHNFPIQYDNFRDTRTLFSLTPGFSKETYFPEVPPGREHHALFDAWRQAVAVQKCYQQLRGYGIVHVNPNSSTSRRTGQT